MLVEYFNWDHVYYTFWTTIVVLRVKFLEILFFQYFIYIIGK